MLQSNSSFRVGRYDMEDKWSFLLPMCNFEKLRQIIYWWSDFKNTYIQTTAREVVEGVHQSILSFQCHSLGE